MTAPLRPCVAGTSSSTTGAAGRRAACDESRGPGPGVVQRPTARDEPGGGPGVTRNAQAQRLLLLFTAAGFAWSWAIGLLVVGVFHGANVAVGGSTFTAVLDVAFGAAALGFAAGLQRGSVQPTRRRSASPSATAAGLAVRPEPAQGLRPRRRRRRDRHASTWTRLPRGAQRDRLRTAWPRGRRAAGRDLRRPLVPDSLRVVRAGGGEPRCGPRLSRRGDGLGPSPPALRPRVGVLGLGGYLVVKGTVHLLT